MKKIIIFITPILILVIFALGCSKDHEAPTFSKYKAISKPVNVEATYDPGQDVVNVTWEMTETAGTTDFLVAVSDSNVFDLGNIREFFTNMEENELSVQPYDYIYDVSTYVDTAVDSMILYFTVSAVYTNETFRFFVGQRAQIDSALVLRR